jgi:Tfp pilus assembly protein PilO
MSRLRRWILGFYRKSREASAKNPSLTTGIFAIALLLGLVVVDRAVSSKRQDLSGRAGQFRAESDFRRQLLVRKDQVERNLGRLETNWVFIRSRFFQEASDELAYAKVQEAIEKLTGGMNISVRSYKFEPKRKDGRITTLPVSLEFSAPYAATVTILASIERSSLQLSISDLEIYPSGDSDALVVRLTVNGYRYEDQR